LWAEEEVVWSRRRHRAPLEKLIIRPFEPRLETPWGLLT